MSDFPAIRLLKRYGYTLAAVAALAVPLGALLLFLCGWSWPVLPAGVVGGALVYLLARSYVELIHIITEMLLPQ
jgi:hypothetical protein